MRLAIVLAVVSILAFTQCAGATVPRTIHYQGVLKDAAGNVVADGDYTFTLKLYDAATGGAPLWTETQLRSVEDGLFDVTLGKVTALTLAFDEAYWLGITIGSDPELEPRIEFASSPYALRAAVAESLEGMAGWSDADWVISGPDIYRLTGNVGIGTSTPGERLDVFGTVRVGGFRMPTTPTDGYVLTTDATGLGTWQPPAGFILPYSGSIAAPGPAFEVTNTGAGDAARFVVDNQSNLSAGLHAEHNGPGAAIRAWATGSGPAGVFKQTGDSSSSSTLVVETSSTAPAVHATTTGGANCAFFEIDNSGNENAAVLCVTNGSGAGVHARATGPDGHPGTFEIADTTSANAAIHAETGGSGPAIYAVNAGSGYAAVFRGNVEIKSKTSGATILELGEGLDYAEGFDVVLDREIAPGAVLAIDPENPGMLTLADRPYDSKVAGIVAGARGLGSGVRLGSDGFDLDVALAGRVYCNVDATECGVEPGDLLTTSATPGYAMKATDRSRAQGAILGKAMEQLEAGTRGQILVLVALQ